MNNIIETIKYKGHEIKVCYDEYAESPDEWGNTDAFLVYEHRDFTVRRDGFDPDDIFERMQDGKKTYDGYWFFPVYAYIHSGVALSLGRNEYPFTDRWDVSFKGFALIQVNCLPNENKAREAAEALIETWNTYLEGDVYGYSSEVGSCHGFYGDEGCADMIKEAKDEIDYTIKKLVSKHFCKMKAWIKNRVPYQYRFQNPAMLMLKDH